MGTLLLKLIVGATAGFLGWLVMEPFAPAISSTNWDTWEGNLILLVGALVGVAVAGLDGYVRGGKVHTFRGAGMGLVCGAVGASLGHAIGGGLSHGIFGGTAMQSGLLPLQILARTVAFVPIGLCLGAAIGASSLNTKKILQGATGGAIGGAVAGALFDPIGAVFGNAILNASGVSRGEVGGPSRAVFFVVMGGAIALFIGLVEMLTRSAWVRLHLGRNEGKEWSIDAVQTFLGRSESAQIPLLGDMNVAPMHASITKDRGQYILADGGSPMGTWVNGQRIMAPLPLWHGAMIQIGSFRLEFLQKNVRSPQPMAIPMPMTAYPMSPNAPAAPQPVPAGMAYAPPMPTPATSQPTVAFQSPPLGGFALIAMDGPLAGQRFPVANAIELGREASGIALPFDTNASRRHAAVSPGVGGVTVTDLGSTNGTFVNGQRVQQSNAGPGAMIKIGITTFRLEQA